MEQEPKRLRDFGYHNTPEYVWETAPLVQYGILPQPGGWDAQDELWKQDYYTWSALQARAAWDRRKRDAHDEDILTKLLGGKPDNEASDWNSFLEGQHGK